MALDDDVVEAERSTWTPAKVAVWAAVALLGGVSWVMLAIVRGETVNAIWFVFAAVCTYFIAYRFYSTYIERKLTRSNDLRAMPAKYKENVPRGGRCLVVHSGHGRRMGAILLLLTFATVVTVTASMYKIFSSVPTIDRLLGGAAPGLQGRADPWGDELRQRSERRGDGGPHPGGERAAGAVEQCGTDRTLSRAGH